MLEGLLVALIVGGIFGGLGALLNWYNSRKWIKRIKSHSYEEIATNWRLWDEFVNSAYEDKRKEIGEDIDVSELVRKDGILADELDWPRFTKLQTEDKIKMLTLTFGEEEPQ